MWAASHRSTKTIDFHNYLKPKTNKSIVCETLQPHILGCQRILTLILKISIADTQTRLKISEQPKDQKK